MNKEAKLYLLQIRFLNIRLDRLRKEIRTMEEQRISLRSIDYGADPVQTSPDGQGFTRMSDKYLDMIDEYKALDAKLTEKRQQIQDEILSLSDYRYMSLLSYMYIDFMTCYQAARAMNYSEGRVRHMHGPAVDLFYTEVLAPRKHSEA